ncbi:STAS/SEC14 domain-containing protein [Pyxidicoccus parkwayensis]|uniref:STAS/SEC14 domain-containing protein n=1 Tax=Pyxidicoccus parkwayensis TaxID=2813578 RepID=A0ABX7P261_9BACT|nr:STAS/SEC14 domain-containing protein [Pyxidicoccus parkwaysis]QSQ23063.1 STAS/SEC14 domain-containing protein [Pyxidicoccus parkwaysis]
MTASSEQSGSSTAQAVLDAPDVVGVFKGRTLGTAMVGNVLVISHNSQAPAQDEWVHYCNLVGRYISTMSAQLVVAEGPGPNATQRQQALDRGSQAMGAVIPPTAVFTRSPLVRGIVTLFNWFTPRSMRAFSPEDVQAAQQHLKMTDAQMQRLLEVAHALLPSEEP